MLYIAEVKRQTKGFIGGSKTVLKLLACQQSDQSWCAVPAEELLVQTEDTNQFGDGALVMLNLGGNRQVLGQPEPANARIVSLLQNFSRLLEKSRGQEEKIEQWRQSLTYQAEELSRREMEFEASREQLEQREEELAQLEQQQAAVEELRLQLERDRAELEGAWEHLHGERQRLEQQKSTAKMLDEQQAHQLQTLSEQLSSAIAPLDTLGEQLNQALATLAQQQGQLEQSAQNLDRLRSEAEQKSAQASQSQEKLNALVEGTQAAQRDLEQAQLQLQVQEKLFENRQETARWLAQQLQAQAELRDALVRLAVTSDAIQISQQVDVGTLENLPLEELEDTVLGLQQSLEKGVAFVEDQEKELHFQRESVEELRTQLQGASEADRVSVERELAEEQDRYRFLEETLMGQRRTLKARENILEQHQQILRRRKGESVEPTDESKIDFGPLLNQVEAQRNSVEEELHKLESQLEQMQETLEQLREQVQQQTQQYQLKHSQLQEMEEMWQQTQMAASKLWSRVQVHEEMLQQQRESLQIIRQHLEAIAQSTHQSSQDGNLPQQAILQMQQALNHLLGIPEMAGEA